MDGDEFKKRLNKITTETSKKIDELNKELKQSSCAGKCYKYGNSAVKIVRVDCDGDLEYVTLNEQKNDNSVFCVFELDYLLKREDKTIENTFGDEITKGEYESIILNRFSRILRME